MKILVVSEMFSRGGLETQIKTYYENLPDKVEMIFAFSSYTNEVSLKNAKIYTGFHFSYNDTVKDLCEDVERLVEIINTEKIDVIHVHPFYSFFAALFASQITKTKLIYSYHGVSSFNFLNSVTIASVFKYAFEAGAVARLHSVSSVGIQCFENIGYKNSVLIPNPVDIRYFKTAEYVNNKKWAIFSRIDLDKIEEIKLFLLNKEKYGIEFVDIYGSGTQTEDLQSFITENNLTDTVEYKGYCNDIYNTINLKYNGIVGIGRVVLEGIAMGIPVFLIGYRKLTGFVNKELYNKTLPLNFTNNRINSTNFEIPDADEIIAIQQDVKEKLSIDSIIETYINSINASDSIYMGSLVKFYYELKALADNPDFSNCYFVNDRNVYNLAHRYIRSYSLDNSLNNMFITADFCYQRNDEAIARDNNIQILYNNLLAETQRQETEIKSQKAEIDELRKYVAALQFKERERFEREQAYYDRRSKKLYIRIGRKIKQILKNKDSK